LLILLQFEEELGFRPRITSTTAEGIREQDLRLGTSLFQKYAANFSPMDQSITLAEHNTSSGVRLKTYTPSSAAPTKPAVCYIHGGGFVVGDVDRDDVLVSRFAKDTGLVFASVEYRLAPQDPYPAGFNDCVDAAVWCSENAKDLRSNGSVIMMGGSAGGALALGTALRLIEEGRGSFLKGIVACQPMTLHPDHVPDEYQAGYVSYVDHADHTLNTAQAMRSFFGRSMDFFAWFVEH
jgi:versiconal hemiacetal acetate esterase